MCLKTATQVETLPSHKSLSWCLGQQPNRIGSLWRKVCWKAISATGWRGLIPATKVEVRVTCSNDKQYTLRMYLPSDFPNSCPHLVVKTSSKLRARNGFLLEEYPGDNHLGYTIDGYTGICHFRPNLWKGENTLYQVFMKGLIWLEAYEAHLRTGQPLSQYLVEM